MIRKWFFLTVIFLFGIFGLLGCSKGKDKKEVIIEADLKYPVKDASAFCLDEKGNLYAYSDELESICVFDKEGVQINSLKVESKQYHELCFFDGKLYALVTEKSDEIFGGSFCLVEVSLKDGLLKILYQDPDLFMVQGMFGNKKGICFIGKKVTSMEDELLSDPSGDYYYGGERLMCYSVETQEVKELDLERIKAIAPKDTSTLWVYGYDMEYGKYYFATYNVEKGTLGERNYVSDSFDVFLNSFAYDAGSDRLIRGDIFQCCLIAMNPKNINSRTEFYTTGAGLQLDYGLVCREGRSYYLLNGEIHRIKNDNYIKAYQPLKVYYNVHEFSMPKGTGFELDMIEVDEETMAMSMMAGDSDYDFLLLSTESSVAEQIRRTGAYEPLNEVPGVKDFLQNSFDFMGDAATDENGGVWMFPCDISCDILVYNPGLCQKYGIDLETKYSNESLLSAQKKLEQAEQSGTPSYYSYNFLRDCDRQTELYLADYAVVNGNACFDTELFRSYSVRYKEEQKRGDNKYFQYATLNPGGNAPGYGATGEEIKEYYDDYFSKVVFASVDKHKLTTKYSHSIGDDSYGLLSYDYFKVKAMPSLEDNKTTQNIASAFLLVLNPNSAHLEEAKEFLSVLAEQLNGEESIFRTKNLTGEYSELEKSVHSIYEKSRIVFSYPEDVFREEYLKYINGKKSLNEVIPELERKLNLYLKE